MAKIIAFALLLILSAAARVQAQPVAPDPVLVQLQARLAAALGGLRPAVVFEVPDGAAGRTLFVRYKTREYQVYPSSMIGEVGRDLVPREGPDDDGLLLSIQVQAKGEVNQAAVPQTMQEPYWSTKLNVYRLAGVDKQAFIGLSFRARTDAALVRKVEQVFEQAAEGGRGPGQVTPAALDRNLPVLEGVFKIHPKFLYRYYLLIDGDGRQICALFGPNGDDAVLARIAPETKVRVRGTLHTRYHAGSTPENLSPFGPAWIIYMNVEQIEPLPAVGGGKK